MSTVEELGEVPPDPIEIISSLESSIEKLVAVSEAVRQDPTDEGIEGVQEQAAIVKDAAQPLIAEKFFSESENEFLIDISVGKFINSGNGLQKKSRDIVGEGVDLWVFNDDTHEQVAKSLITKDMSEFGTVTSKSGEEVDEEEAFQILLEAVMEMLDEQFSSIIDQYVDSVMSDSKVEEYIQRRQDELQAEAERFLLRSERFKQARLMAGCLAVSIVGGYIGGRIGKQ